MEALRRQKRLMHGVERRQSLRLHKMLKEAATALGGAAGLYKHSASGAGPCFAQAVLACLQHRGRLSEDAQIADWARIPQVRSWQRAQWRRAPVGGCWLTTRLTGR